MVALSHYICLLWLMWLNWLGYRPIHQKAVGLIPSHGIYLEVAGSYSSQGAHREQKSVFLSHQYF